MAGIPHSHYQGQAYGYISVLRSVVLSRLRPDRMSHCVSGYKD